MRSREILSILVEQCLQQGLFVPGTVPDAQADLVETGHVDSMGLVQLQALIEEQFDVVVPAAVFVAELRTLARIAQYLEAEQRAGRVRLAGAPVTE